MHRYSLLPISYKNSALLAGMFTQIAPGASIPNNYDATLPFFTHLFPSFPFPLFTLSSSPFPYSPLPSPLPLPFLPVFPPLLPLEVGPLNPARGSGERCKFPRGSGAEPLPKLNLVHFTSFKI